MKKLMKGNEAIAEAAIQAGCRFFFGYPITPQNEIPEYMSRRLPEVGGCFLQAESEVSAINMVYGAGGAGGRVMTSSSSPGISLKQEGISYLVGAEVPCVIVNMVRGGPGLGGIQPAQSDYYQSTRGGGHGDYRLCVLAPSSVQEAVDLTKNAFTIADRYRNPVLVLGDGMIGQMMEPVDMEKPTGMENVTPEKPWAADGHVPTAKRPRAIINSLYIDPKVLEQHCLKLEAKYQSITENECAWQEEMLSDAEIVLVAYGTTSRICRSAMRKCREEGIKVGMIRPITLWPFPDKAIQKALSTAKHYLSVEMSTGQMVDDVRLAVNGECPVHFYGRTGGMVPTVSEIVAEIKKYAAGETPDDDDSFDEIEINFKATMGKMKQKLKEAGDAIDGVDTAEMEKKIRDAADTLAKRMQETAQKMEQKIKEAGAPQESAESEAEPKDESDDELSLEDVGKKFEDAAKTVEKKFTEAGKKLDELLKDPKTQKKAEDAGQQINDLMNRTGKAVTSGMENLMKIVSHAAESVKNDLKDAKKPDDSQDKEGK